MTLAYLAHRGLWGGKAAPNSFGAMRAAWARGWGVETDLRDCAGSVVVSHDPPSGDELTFEALLQGHALHGLGTTLALNIKADGLAPVVAAALTKHAVPVEDVFVFDMSVPDTFSWLDVGVPVLARWSDVERNPVLVERSSGVWLDAFQDDEWWGSSELEAVRQDGRVLALVSPELHRRDPAPAWVRLAALRHLWPERTWLCTDRPDDAKQVLA